MSKEDPAGAEKQSRGEALCLWGASAKALKQGQRERQNQGQRERHGQRERQGQGCRTHTGS